MPTGQRLTTKPVMIAFGIALVAGLVGAALWTTQSPPDERPLRRRLEALGVIATLDTNGQSISSVNLASIKDKNRVNEALEIVLQLDRIASLSLNGMPITNADLERIGQLSTLVTLSLSDCGVGGAGYAPLGNLNNLQYLHLPGTQTVDDDLKSLTDITSLVSIDLSRTKVKNDLSPLAELPQLKWLLLTRDSLNEGALAGLSAAPLLTRVTLTDAKFADSDLRALQSAKPSIKFD